MAITLREEPKETMRRLIDAARRNDTDELRILCSSNPDLLYDVVSPSWQNPVAIAVKHGNRAFVKECLALNSKLAGNPDQQGYTPYHLVAATGHTQIMDALLSVEHHGEYCLLMDGDLRIPLHVAATKGNVGILRTLIRECPDSVEILTDQGQTFVHLAVKIKRPHIVRAAVEELSRLNKTHILNQADREGNTAVHLAVSMKQSSILELLLTSNTTASTAKQVNTKNNNGFTALDLLFQSPYEYQDREIQEILIRAGAVQGADLHDFRTRNQPHQTKRRTSAVTRLLTFRFETHDILLAAATAFVGIFFQISQQDKDGDLSMRNWSKNSCIEFVRHPRLVLPVLRLIFNAAGVVGITVPVTVILWSFPHQREIYLFTWFMVIMCYGLHMFSLVPGFVIICFGFHIPGFCFVCLGAIILIIFALFLKLLLIIFKRSFIR